MPPILHCVRHAQGWHNLPGYDMSRRDPDLTPKGEQQCTALASTFPHHAHVSQVFASPLRRTLATAAIAFQPSLANSHCDPIILALPDAQETSEYACDTGSDREELRRICDEAGWKVDLGMVPEGWNDKSWDGKWAPTARAIRARTREARRTIRDRVLEIQKREGVESPHVVLVCHGGCLHYLTEDWEDSDKFCGTAWANTEYRSYTFDGDDDNACIRETPESRRRRGKHGRQPTRVEQRQMFEAAMLHWERQGMQDGEKVGWRDGDEVVQVQKRKETNGVDGGGKEGEEPAAGPGVVVPVEMRKVGAKSGEVRL